MTFGSGPISPSHSNEAPGSLKWPHLLALAVTCTEGAEQRGRPDQ